MHCSPCKARGFIRLGTVSVGNEMWCRDCFKDKNQIRQPKVRGGTVAEPIRFKFLKLRKLDRNEIRKATKMCFHCLLGRHIVCPGPMSCPCVHHEMVADGTLVGNYMR